MRTNDRNCSGCRYWSEMIAQSIGGHAVEAMCLAPSGPAQGKYMVGSQTCTSFAKNTAGAVDDPPDYGEDARHLYHQQALAKHPNGAPMYAPDGTMLDDRGNRSIFDDVDE
jgi:hypothetical protein